MKQFGILKIKIKILSALLLCVLLTCICGCRKESIQNEFFFHPNNLFKLDLAELSGFWNDSLRIDTSFGGGPGVLFEIQPGFLDGLGLYNEVQFVWVNVFSSADTAILAMESRIANVAAVIKIGTTEKVKGKWWFAEDGWNYSVFVNTWNTIIEATIFNVDDNEVEKIYDAVNLLVGRVEKLSQ